MAAKFGAGTIIALLIWGVVVGAVVLSLMPHESSDPTKLDCLVNVKNLLGLLEVVRGDNPTEYGGPDLLLYLVMRGDLEGEDSLRILFCPGDERESFEKAGGLAAFRVLDLTIPAGHRGHLTSYAGASKGSTPTQSRGGPAGRVLLCDDSEDHHVGGIVVGLTGGAVKWRDRIDHYDLPDDVPITFGPRSAIAELRCLESD